MSPNLIKNILDRKILLDLLSPSDVKHMANILEVSPDSLIILDSTIRA